MNVKTITYRIQFTDKGSYVFNRYETLEVCAEIQPGDNVRECAMELIKIGNNSLFNPRHKHNQTELIDPDVPPEVEDYIPTEDKLIFDPEVPDYIPDDEDEIPY